MLVPVSRDGVVAGRQSPRFAGPLLVVERSVQRLPGAPHGVDQGIGRLAIAGRGERNRDRSLGGEDVVPVPGVVGAAGGHRLGLDVAFAHSLLLHALQSPVTNAPILVRISPVFRPDPYSVGTVIPVALMRKLCRLSRCKGCHGEHGHQRDWPTSHLWFVLHPSQIAQNPRLPKDRSCSSKLRIQKPRESRAGPAPWPRLPAALNCLGPGPVTVGKTGRFRTLGFWFSQPSVELHERRDHERPAE